MFPGMERLTLIGRLWRALRTIGLIVSVLVTLVGVAFILSWFGVIPSPIQLVRDAIETIRDVDWKMVLAMIFGVPLAIMVLDDLLGLRPRRGPEDH